MTLPAVDAARLAAAAATPESIVTLAGVEHRYGARLALAGVSLHVAAGEIFALLGPNGSGKTTLFRLLSTLAPLARGEATVCGFDLRRQTALVRRAIGVVFQSPSLDKQLTVAENIRHQAALYGLAGAEQRRRAAELLDAFQLADRAGERCGRLSGGLRRRVELAKGMIHRPRLLLLDEPSTGLDPAARLDLWRRLRELRDEHGVTVMLTTHLLDEADKADRVAILDAGRLAALDTPAALCAAVGGDTITIEADEPADLAAAIAARFELPVQPLDDQVRLELPDARLWVARLVEAFPGRIRSLRLGRPSLEDVFIARTGHRFERPAADAAEDSGHG